MSNKLLVLGLLLTGCGVEGSDPPPTEDTTQALISNFYISPTYTCHEAYGCNYNLAGSIPNRYCYITNIAGDLHGADGGGATILQPNPYEVGTSGQISLYVDEGLSAAAACIDNVTYVSGGTWSPGDPQQNLGHAPAGKTRVCGFTSIVSYHGFGVASDWVHVRDQSGTWNLNGQFASNEDIDASAVCWDETGVVGPFYQPNTNGLSIQIPAAPAPVPRACALTRVGGQFTTATTQSQVWWDGYVTPHVWRLYTKGANAEAYCFN